MPNCGGGEQATISNQKLTATKRAEVLAFSKNTTSDEPCNKIDGGASNDGPYGDVPPNICGNEKHADEHNSEQRLRQPSVRNEHQFHTVVGL